MLVSGLLKVDYVTHKRLAKVGKVARLGSKYGGWAIPVGHIDKKSVCYCVGCGEDISFDLELIERFDCEVFAYDPTPRAIEYCARAAGHIDKYHFFGIGLWDKDEILKFYEPQNSEHVSHSICNLQSTDSYFEAECKRLSHIMANNGHDRIDVLKLDIEGAEYKVLESIKEDGLDIRVICVEYDEYNNPPDADYMKRIRQSIEALSENGYKIVVAENNGNFTLVKIDGGN